MCVTSEGVVCKTPCKAQGDLIIDSGIYMSGPSQKTLECYQECYHEWVKVNNADPSTLKPINIELGKGNSKCIESTGSAMHNLFRYNAEVNKNPNAVSYLPEHVMKQNMGLEQQQEEDLMSQDLLFDSDDDQLINDTARQQQNDFTPG